MDLDDVAPLPGEHAPGLITPSALMRNPASVIERIAEIHPVGLGTVNQ